MASWIVQALRGYCVALLGGVPLPSRSRLNFVSGATVTDNPAKGSTDVVIGGGGTSPTFDTVTTTDGATIGGDLTVDGDLVMGPFLARDVRGVTTVGGASAPLLSFPLPTNSRAALYLLIVGTDGSSHGFQVETVAGLGVSTFGGTFAEPGPSPSAIITNNFPLSPGGSTPTSWSAGPPGTLSIVIGGPSAAIIGAMDNGSGGTRLSLDTSVNTNPITSAITGELVDIAGVVGGGALNGTSRTATWVSNSQIDVNVSFTGYTSGGVITEHTPRTIIWSAWGRLVVSP